MTKTLKFAAFTALTLVAAGSIAEASQNGKQPTSSNRGTVQRQHQGSSNSTSVKPQGMGSQTKLPVVTSQNSKPPIVTGQNNKPPVITHCDPLPCKGTKPGQDPIEVVEHHKPHHWPHKHHHHHDRYDSDYRYGSGYYQSGTYYRPQPSYAANAPAPAAQIPAASCLAKEYLANGPVLFKDTCTKEWAMGDAAANRFVNVGCLRKDYVGDGKVRFTDVCTKEWAMNPPAGQQTSSATQSEEDDD